MGASRLIDHNRVITLRLGAPCDCPALEAAFRAASKAPPALVAIHGEAAHEEPDAICPRLHRSIRQRLVAIEAPDDRPVELALLPPAFPFQGDVGPCDREPRAVP